MLKISENESLKNHSTFRIGGSAKYFAIAKTSEEVQEAIDWAEGKKINFKIIGGGSNILFNDDGYSGLIVKYFGGQAGFNGEIVECPAGVVLASVMNDSLARGLLGLEWAIGIPGTIGGAIHNNAGAYGGEMSQSAVKVKVLRGGKIIEVDNAGCRFGYRESFFKRADSEDIIISATLKLKAASAGELDSAREKMKANLADRLSKASEGPSAGSTFRNLVLTQAEIDLVKKDHPELPDQYVAWRKIPAAWLIDQCELRGRKVGGAMVSNNHAGKITNIGKATAKDIVMLISIVKQKVRSRFNLQLMEEIEYIGF